MIIRRAKKVKGRLMIGDLKIKLMMKVFFLSLRRLILADGWAPDAVAAVELANRWVK